MQKLVLHPDCASGPIHTVHAGLTATAQGCRARFKLIGNIDAIKVPRHAPSVREDNLWKTTCFEIFWQPIGTSAYREFNLSPSSKWACYDFDDFRENMRNAPLDSVAIAGASTAANSEGELTLEASIACDLAVPARAALNAIVEDRGGNIQFWALSFPAGKPEFHSDACRALHLESIE